VGSGLVLVSGVWCLVSGFWFVQAIEICRVRQIVRDRVRRARAEGFISSAAIARKGDQKFYIIRR